MRTVLCLTLTGCCLLLAGCAGQPLLPYTLGHVRQTGIFPTRG